MYQKKKTFFQIINRINVKMRESNKRKDETYKKKLTELICKKRKKLS